MKSQQLSKLTRRELLLALTTTPLLACAYEKKDQSLAQRGITFPKSVISALPCLHENAIDFVVRYYSSHPSHKMISHEECQVIFANGLSAVLVYQNINQSPQDFTAEHARKNAQHALSLASTTIKQKHGSAIYFAVDYDATREDIEHYILNYFKIINQFFAGSGYQVGVYGSGLVCRYIKNKEKLAHYSMLSLAYKWRESQTYQDWDIFQGFGKGDLCGIDANIREDCKAKNNNYGQFNTFQQA